MLECSVSQRIWSKFAKYCLDELNYKFEINEINCILGISIPNKMTKEVNELAIIVKKILYKPVTERKDVPYTYLKMILNERRLINHKIARPNITKNTL